MKIYFRAKPSLILSWLNAKGYGGTVHDAAVKYFQTKATNKNGSLFDLINEALINAGY